MPDSPQQRPAQSGPVQHPTASRIVPSPESIDRRDRAAVHGVFRLACEADGETAHVAARWKRQIPIACPLPSRAAEWLNAAAAVQQSSHLAPQPLHRWRKDAAVGQDERCDRMARLGSSPLQTACDFRRSHHIVDVRNNGSAHIHQPSLKPFCWFRAALLPATPRCVSATHQTATRTNKTHTHTFPFLASKSLTSSPPRQDSIQHTLLILPKPPSPPLISLPPLILTPRNHPRRDKQKDHVHRKSTESPNPTTKKSPSAPCCPFAPLLLLSSLVT